MTRPTEPTGKRGVSYIRVSRDQQETARQRDTIGLWLVRLGLTLTHTYEDTGSRDLAAKRPGFQRLLITAAARAVIPASFSRRFAFPCLGLFCRGWPLR